MREAWRRTYILVDLGTRSSPEHFDEFALVYWSGGFLDYLHVIGRQQEIYIIADLLRFAYLYKIAY